VRCFLAVDLAPRVRAAVGELQGRLRSRAGAADVRWTAPEGMHLTLKFLGEVAEPRIDAVVEAVRVVAAATPMLALVAGGVGAFPTPRRPRVVWVGLTGGADALARLAGALDQALAAVGFVPEARAFHAHVTLGRVRSPRGLRVLAGALAAEAGAEYGAWRAGEAVLYRSYLRPTGSVYEVLARLPFATADA
jgi:2'-5' RNA ligase